jgi:hypothetical protein
MSDYENFKEEDKKLISKILFVYEKRYTTKEKTIKSLIPIYKKYGKEPPNLSSQNDNISENKLEIELDKEFDNEKKELKKEIIDFKLEINNGMHKESNEDLIIINNEENKKKLFNIEEENKNKLLNIEENKRKLEEEKKILMEEEDKRKKIKEEEEIKRLKLKKEERINKLKEEEIQKKKIEEDNKKLKESEETKKKLKEMEENKLKEIEEKKRIEEIIRIKKEEEEEELEEIEFQKRKKERLLKMQKEEEEYQIRMKKIDEESKKNDEERLKKIRKEEEEFLLKLEKIKNENELLIKNHNELLMKKENELLIKKENELLIEKENEHLIKNKNNEIHKDINKNEELLKRDSNIKLNKKNFIEKLEEKERIEEKIEIIKKEPSEFQKNSKNKFLKILEFFEGNIIIKLKVEHSKFSFYSDIFNLLKKISSSDIISKKYSNYLKFVFNQYSNNSKINQKDFHKLFIDFNNLLIDKFEDEGVLFKQIDENKNNSIEFMEFRRFTDHLFTKSNVKFVNEIKIDEKNINNHEFIYLFDIFSIKISHSNLFDLILLNNLLKNDSKTIQKTILTSLLFCFFSIFDFDGNKVLDREEMTLLFTDMVNMKKVNDKNLLSESNVSHLISSIDKNNDGSIEWKEFYNYVISHMY